VQAEAAVGWFGSLTRFSCARASGRLDEGWLLLSGILTSPPTVFIVTCLKVELSFACRCLHRAEPFAKVGLVRKGAVNGGPSAFDTDAGDHEYFYIASEDRIFDDSGSPALGLVRELGGKQVAPCAPVAGVRRAYCGGDQIEIDPASLVNRGPDLCFRTLPHQSAW
jgi:hypothetical protein